MSAALGLIDIVHGLAFSLAASVAASASLTTASASLSSCTSCVAESCSLSHSICVCTPTTRPLCASTTAEPDVPPKHGYLSIYTEKE